MRKAPCTPRKTPVRSKIEEEYIVAASGVIREENGSEPISFLRRRTHTTTN